MYNKLLIPKYLKHNFSKHEICFFSLWFPAMPSGEGNGTPLQYSCLENPMDGGAWWAAVHGVSKSRTRLSDFTVMHWRRKWQPTPVFCLENPRDGRAWWAAVYGVAQSRTRLKWLSSSSSSSSYVFSSESKVHWDLWCLNGQDHCTDGQVCSEDQQRAVAPYSV